MLQPSSVRSDAGALGVSLLAGKPSLFLQQGDSASLYYACQAPISWSEQQHAEAEVMVLYAPAVCRLRWRNGSEAWKEMILKGPAVCLLPPRLTHRLQWEREAELIALYLRPVLFKRLNGGIAALNAWDEPTSFAAGDLFVWPFFAALRHLLRLEARLDRAYIDALGTLVAGNLTLSLWAMPGVKDSETTFSHQKLKAVTDYIQANLAQSVQVQDLAKQVGLSRKHFAEVFKNSLGLSPHEYLTRCRVLRAQDLLASGEHRIREVAEAAGFCDQSHLTRQFKKLLGYSPKVEAVRGRDSRPPF
jgi:AraC family transcriptional regulator